MKSEVGGLLIVILIVLSSSAIAQKSERKYNAKLIKSPLSMPELDLLKECLDIEILRFKCDLPYKFSMSFSVERFEKRSKTSKSLDSVTASIGSDELYRRLRELGYKREMICERTRNKVAAARKKGKWTGGMPVLGYDVCPEGRKLVVSKEEAKRVKEIFNLYTELQSLGEVVDELGRRGWTRKRWITRNEKERGGKPFTKNSLHGLLTNILYTGKVAFQGESHKGEHQAIVPEKLFRKVQRLLKRNGTACNRNGTNSLLKGILFCAPCNRSMTPTSTRKGNRRYRYYVCQGARMAGWKSCPSKSIPGAEIERYVVDQIRCIGKDPALRKEVLKQIKSQGRAQGRELEREQRSLDRTLERKNASLQKLVAKGQGGSDRVAELVGQIREIEKRANLVRAELKSYKENQIDEAQVARLLEEFDALWEALTPKEQAQVVRLLVQRIDYNGEKGTISITFLPTGISALSGQLEEEAA